MSVSGVVPSGLLPTVVVMGITFSPPSSPLKCDRQPPEGKPLVAIDGELTDQTVDDINREEIRSLEIVCMNPEDSTFNRSRGIPVISIWTRGGPASYLESTLTAILEAQDAHFRTHSTYLDKLSEIELPERPATMRVTLDAEDSGWVATAAIDRMLTKCVVYDGEVSRPHPRVPRRQPTCLSDRELGL